MTNLDGLCQGGPEGENIQKLPALVKGPKKQKKRSMNESCENLIYGTADGREERENGQIDSDIVWIGIYNSACPCAVCFK